MDDLLLCTTPSPPDLTRHISPFAFPRAIANFWEWLSSLGLAKGSTVEPFGSVDNLIATLIRMKYLAKVTVPSLEQNTVFYRWGQRARREVSEKSVVTFLALVGGRSRIRVVSKARLMAHRTFLFHFCSLLGSRSEPSCRVVTNGQRGLAPPLSLQSPIDSKLKITI
jgi:hypothetical protein